MTISMASTNHNAPGAPCCSIIVIWYHEAEWVKTFNVTCCTANYLAALTRVCVVIQSRMYGTFRAHWVQVIPGLEHLDLSILSK